MRTRKILLSDFQFIRTIFLISLFNLLLCACGEDISHTSKESFAARKPQQESGLILLVNDSEFIKSVINANSPVLVDFCAEWQKDCKILDLDLEAISEAYVGKLIVAKINIDENPQTLKLYGVRGVPTLMLFKNGEVEATKVGRLTKSELTAFIDFNI